MKEDNEMEEWMNTWQEMAGEGDVVELREKFASAQWGRRIKDIIAVGIMGAAIVAVLWSLSVATAASELIYLGGGLVVASVLLGKRYQRMRRERAALPLSAGQYLEASRHNLGLLVRDNRFVRWIFPVVVPAIMLTNIWLLTDFSDVYFGLNATSGLLLAVMTGLLIYALWMAYVGRPRQLEREAEALEKLRDELEAK